MMIQSLQDLGAAISQTMQTVDPVAKRAMLMHLYVETLRQMNDANDRGDAASADRFFRSAHALCDQYQGRNPAVASFS